MFRRGHTGKLALPVWPPELGVGMQPFVRGFGPAQRRRRGADNAWTDEQSYCNAARAIRFEALPKLLLTNDNQVRCAFRRLFYDGLAVARVEIGLSYSRTDERKRYPVEDFFKTGNRLNDKINVDLDPLKILDQLLSLRTIVPVSGSQADRKSRPLITQARQLAHFYAESTTDHKAKNPRLAFHDIVVAGSPLVIVECRSSHITCLDNRFKRVDPSQTALVDLAFGRVKTKYGELGIWFAGSDNSSFSRLRSLRLCIARLHAEAEVLQSVLSRLNNDTLVFEPGTTHGDKIEGYINEATRWINKTRWAGIEQSKILEAFVATEKSPKKQELVMLREKLSGAREQIKRKVDRFVDMSGHMINYFSEKTEMKIVNIGPNSEISAPITVADSIQESFNTLNNSHLDNELEEFMKDLLMQISEASKTINEEYAAQLASEIEDLVREVKRENPRPRNFKLSVQTIKNVALKIGEVGEPILKTCGKLLPLLLRLYNTTK